MELSVKQKEIVMTNKSEVIVIAAAAAGKTRVLTERIKYLLNQGTDPKKIVAITFTNAAAEELLGRVGRPAGLFIGTIHSYANYLLRSIGVDTSKWLEDEDFDMLFELVKAHPKCIKEVEHLLLDESQDSNMLQFKFLLDMVMPKNYMLVGDYRQSIYRFAGARPDIILNMCEDPNVTVYNLNENYRNGSDILQYAKTIIHLNGYEYDDHSIPMRNVTGKVIEVDYSPSAIAKTIKKYGNYKDWFILTRSNAQIDEMIEYLRQEGVPFDTFKKAQLKNSELNKKMKEDTVKVLTVHTAKGLEAPNVIVIGVKFFNVEEKCIGYVAATRARDLLVWATVRRKGKKRIENWL